MPSEGKEFLADVLDATGHPIGRARCRVEFDRADFEKDRRPGRWHFGEDVAGRLEMSGAETLLSEGHNRSGYYYLRRGDFYWSLKVTGCAGDTATFADGPPLWYLLEELGDLSSPPPEPTLPVHADRLYRCRRDLALSTRDCDRGGSEDDVPIPAGSLIAVSMPNPSGRVIVFWSDCCGRLVGGTWSDLAVSELAEACELACLVADYRGPRADELRVRT